MLPSWGIARKRKSECLKKTKGNKYIHKAKKTIGRKVTRKKEKEKDTREVEEESEVKRKRKEGGGRR